MNRKERRKAGKTEKVAVYNLTADQIDQLKQEAVDEAALVAFKMFMAVPIMVLHDKFGFGSLRAQRFMDYAMIWYESVQKNETSLKEIMKIAEELTGVQFILDSIPDKK